MRGHYQRAIGMIMIVAGVAMIAIATLTGEMEFALFLIFPIMYGSGAVAAVGVLLMFGGLIVLLFSLVPKVTQEGKTLGEGRARGGGVVLIGPIPIVFGTDWNMALLAIVLTIVLVVVVFLLFF